MVRDLILDMKERDLLTDDKVNPAIPVFDSLWGDLFDEDAMHDFLICNIIIPEAYWNMITYTDNEMTLNFRSDYVPDINYFRVRPVALKNGVYSLFSGITDDFGASVSSYALSKNIASPIIASMLPYIDIDGEFSVRLVRNGKSPEKAYIYSSKKSDLYISYSDSQSAQLLAMCAPGNCYRFPTLGVGSTYYLNSVIEHTDFEEVLKKQFDADRRSIRDVIFDNQTGEMDILCMPEQEIPDENLESIDNLNMDFFSMFSDDYVRKNVVLDGISDTDFINMLNSYPRMLELFMFKDDATSVDHIAAHTIPGRFDHEGKMVSDSEHYIVTATLEANTVIMFDDEAADTVVDTPIFIVNGNNETRLYTSLVGQPYWIAETCHKCMILKQRSTIKYMIRQDRFKAGKGLYVVHQTSENIKNMVGIVHDVHTGRLLGIVSNNTNISDISLDEIVQHIYVSQIN